MPMLQPSTAGCPLQPQKSQGLGFMIRFLGIKFKVVGFKVSGLGLWCLPFRASEFEIESLFTWYTSGFGAEDLIPLVHFCVHGVFPCYASFT